MLKGKEERKCTVIKKAEIKKTITLEDYREGIPVLCENMQMRKMNVIRANKHEFFTEFFTETINKIALSTNDDKKRR